MKRSIAAIIAFGLTAAPVLAQSPAPTPPASAAASPSASPSAAPNADTGWTRSLKAVGSAGQTGTVTFYRHSSTTLIAAVLDGPTDRTQSMRIYRGTGCDALDTAAAFTLNDTRAGSSVSTVNIDVGRLLSGNYNLVALSSNKADAVATSCIHLMK